MVICLTFISHGIVRLLGGQVSTGPTISEEDLKTIVNVSHEEGVLEDEEKEMPRANSSLTLLIQKSEKS